jgi:epoxyqueuosine reductase
MVEILLHVCCAPCLIYPFSRLKNKGFKISGFYYNPNIYPLEEYTRRKEALETLSKDLQLEVEYSDYRQSDFLQAVNLQKQAEERCLICWRLRLQKTANRAKEKGLTTFSTTLLVSPYQDHEQLRQLGMQIGRQTGVNFYYEDFRVGFKQAQIEAKHRGLYRQRYCGCSLSEIKQCKKLETQENYSGY